MYRIQFDRKNKYGIRVSLNGIALAYFCHMKYAEQYCLDNPL
jgi:hypothetical protein